MSEHRLSDSDVAQFQAQLEKALYELKRIIVGQHHLLERLLIALMGQGHVLVQGVPGLAKTLTLNALSRVVNVSFQRIQFTPDLIPADIIGTRIFNPGQSTFTTEKGPIFAHFILADEINRAPAKVQSALLEAMQEDQVTIGKETFPLPQPFLVMATQNPIESEGTYSLPEAQLDRFMMQVNVGYPSGEDELLITERYCHDRHLGLDHIQPVFQSAEELLAVANATQQVFVDSQLMAGIVRWVQATRHSQHNDIAMGASPRATLSLVTAARGMALLQGRNYIIEDDIHAVALDCLRHRVRLSFNALTQQKTVDMVLTQLFEQTPLQREPVRMG